MTRLLLCRKCGENYSLGKEDRAMGLDQRKLFVGPISRPANHGITINGKFHPHPHVGCDHCNNKLDGEIGIAITIWKPAEVSEPGIWETEFGQLQPPAAVNVGDALKGKEPNP